MKKVTGLVVLVVLLASTAQVMSMAQITYVDAVPNTNGTDGNTTIDGALVDFNSNAVTDSVEPAGHPNDGKWLFQTGLTGLNGDNVWRTGTDEAGVAPLVTTLTLAPGTYNLYGLFYNNNANTGRWDVGFRVGTEGGFITWHGWQNASATPEDSTGLFANPVKTRDGGSWLCIAPLGQYTVTDTIDIYVYSPVRPGEPDQPTVYDGVGYELVDEQDALWPIDDVLIARDSFGDGDRNNDGDRDDPDGSGSGVVDDAADVGLKWFKVDESATVGQTFRVAHDVAAPAGLGEDNALFIEAGAPANVVANFAPVSLKNPDEYIRLTFQFRMTEPVPMGDTFRFGLFHEGATRVKSDQQDMGVVKDDAGYIGAVATIQYGPGHIAIGHPDHYWEGLALNPLPLFGQDLWFGGHLPAPEPAWNNSTIVDTNAHKIEMTITRSADDRVWIDVAIDDAVPSRCTWTVSPGYVDRAPVLFFNQVAFGTSPPYEWYQGLDYAIDDVVIEASVYKAPCADFVGDADLDDDVDMDDFAALQRCLTVGTAAPGVLSADCKCFDFTKDGAIDVADMEVFMDCAGGPGVKPACAP